MRKIDAHVHINGDHADWEVLMARMDLVMLNVCVAHDASGLWREERAAFRGLAARDPTRYAWCTTFDPPTWGDDEYAERVIAEIERDTTAVGCKIWKNIGMSVRRPSGEFLLPDDPILDPIYAYLARTGRTLLAHIAEPRACWMALDENDPHYGYYSAHPEWHMYNRPDYPSHRQLVDARDHVLVKHPHLRMVGAHLGSLEYDVREVARRLDLYPNLAVDTSARTRDLTYQDTGVVRDFFQAYQDRILFGTDIVLRGSQSALAASERQRNVEQVAARYAAEFSYYEQSGVIEIRGWQATGLGLAPSTLTKIYYANAVHWYPGIESSAPRK